MHWGANVETHSDEGDFLDLVSSPFKPKRHFPCAIVTQVNTPPTERKYVFWPWPHFTSSRLPLAVSGEEPEQSSWREVYMTLKVERKRHYHPTDWQKFKRLMMPRFDLDVKKLVPHAFFVGVNIGKAIFLESIWHYLSDSTMCILWGPEPHFKILPSTYFIQVYNHSLQRHPCSSIAIRGKWNWKLPECI